MLLIEKCTWLSVLFVSFVFHSLPAQTTIEKDEPVKVSNDNAADAATLWVDSAYYKSTTTNCTLEDSCLNRKLTARCLVYHNDQWFTFRTSDAPVYYLIVKGQNCRDINGVQVLVIDGCICQPATYTILKCVSFATQDDISLTLNELKPNHQYILNLDGYLNDFCEFEISISTRPPDFHVRTDQQIPVTAKNRKSKINFEWKLSDELKNLEIAKFEIVRRFQTEKKYGSVGTVEVERSVHGDYTRDYTFTDSVAKSGFYYYKVLAVSNRGERFLLSEHSFKVVIYPNLIALYLDVKKESIITIEIYNYPDNRYLGNYKAVYRDDFKLDLKPYLKNNDTEKLKLLITDLKGKFKKEIIVDVN